VELGIAGHGRRGSAMRAVVVLRWLQRLNGAGWLDIRLGWGALGEEVIGDVTQRGRRTKWGRTACSGSCAVAQRKGLG
jgi:hypothetical protein